MAEETPAGDDAQEVEAAEEGTEVPPDDGEAPVEETEVPIDEAEAPGEETEAPVEEPLESVEESEVPVEEAVVPETEAVDEDGPDADPQIGEQDLGAPAEELPDIAEEDQEEENQNQLIEAQEVEPLSTKSGVPDHLFTEEGHLRATDGRNIEKISDELARINLR